MRIAPIVLLALFGCSEPDPHADLMKQWRADSARYASINDCGMVPAKEAQDCERVLGVLWRQYIREQETLARREEISRLNRVRQDRRTQMLEGIATGAIPTDSSRRAQISP